MKRNGYILLTTVAILSLVSLLITSAKTRPMAVVTVGQEWKAGTVMSEKELKTTGVDKCFTIEIISDKIFKRIEGKSYKKGCTIARDDLRYLKLLHKDKDGRTLRGEMIVNRQIADDIIEIFHTLYDNNYPIERIMLIDDFNADDEQSMRANNTSSFCYRAVSGTKTLSAHARGMAVDINTLYNPYVKKQKDGTLKIQPSTAKPYIDRTKSFPYKIEKDDLCHRLFIKHGFTWGGSWRNSKDYQHFEKH